MSDSQRFSGCSLTRWSLFSADNGGGFLLFKLSMGELTRSDNPEYGSPEYGLSRLFDLVNPESDLYAVLRVLNKIRMLA